MDTPSQQPHVVLRKADGTTTRVPLSDIPVSHPSIPAAAISPASSPSSPEQTDAFETLVTSFESQAGGLSSPEDQEENQENVIMATKKLDKQKESFVPAATPTQIATQH